jgi:membrane protein required for colicin V production
MNLIDIIIIIFAIVLCIRGYLRGFINEVFSLLIIICGLIGAFLFYRPLSETFMEFIGSRDLSMILAFFAIFIFITIVLIIIRNMLIRVIDRLNLTDIDNILGVVVGLIKGLLICGVILVFLKNHPVFRIDEMIGRSSLFPYLEKIFISLIALLPERIMVFINKVLGIA